MIEKSSISVREWTGSSSEIQRVLEIQSQYQLHRDHPAPDPSKGFLLSGYSLGELEGLVSGGGSLYLAETNARINGYLLVTDGKTFGPRHPQTSAIWSREDLRAAFSSGEFAYFDQVGVDTVQTKKGLARALFQQAEMHARYDVCLAAIAMRPWPNLRSESFMRSAGFHDSGRFHTPNFRGTADLESIIFAKKLGVIRAGV